jgi:hypothetical protein
MDAKPTILVTSDEEILSNVETIMMRYEEVENQP